jgi:hypothetical protein
MLPLACLLLWACLVAASLPLYCCPSAIADAIVQLSLHPHCFVLCQLL